MSQKNSKLSTVGSTLLLTKNFVKLVWKNYKISVFIPVLFSAFLLLGIFLGKTKKKEEPGSLDKKPEITKEEEEILLKNLPKSLKHEEICEQYIYLNSLRQRYTNPISIEEKDKITTKFYYENDIKETDFELVSKIYTDSTLREFITKLNLLNLVHSDVLLSSSFLSLDNDKIKELKIILAQESSLDESIGYSDYSLGTEISSIVNLIKSKGNRFVGPEKAFLYVNQVKETIDILKTETNPTPLKIYFFPVSIAEDILEFVTMIGKWMTIILFFSLASSVVLFYGELVHEKVLKYFNVIGFTYLSQYFATYLTVFILCGHVILTFSLSDAMNSGSGFSFPIFLTTIAVNTYSFILSISVSLITIKFTYSISKQIGPLVSLVSFCAPLLLPEPKNSTWFYKYLFYFWPANFYLYFFNSKDSNSLLIEEKYSEIFMATYKETNFLKVLGVQLIFGITINILSYFAFSLEELSISQILDSITGLGGHFLSLFRKKKRVPKMIEQNLTKDHSLDEGDISDHLVVRNLSKTYRTFGEIFKALSNVSLKIKKGEKVALLGHNGAGKTTFITTLIGEVPRSNGTITLNTKHISGLKDLSGKLGFCPQYTATIPGFTIEENLGVIRSLYDIEESKIIKILTDLELIDLKDKLAKDVSGGQKRKLAFAMAILSSPPLIILDEPSTGVDILARKKMYNLLRAYAQNSIVIYSTHLIEEAEEHADKVAILSAGKLMAFDTVSNIKRKFNILNNRLSVNFIHLDCQTQKKVLTEKLSEFAESKVLSEKEKNITFSINNISYEGLAQLYEFINAEKRNLGIMSYGFSKAKLEEVLNLEDFKELQIAEHEKCKDAEAKLANDIKPMAVNKIKSFNIVLALLYSSWRSIFLNVVSLLILISTGAAFFLLYFKTNYDNAESFARIPFSFKEFGYSTKHKLKIQVINPAPETDEFIKSLETGVHKDYIEILPKVEDTDLNDNNLAYKAKYADSSDYKNSNDKKSIKFLSNLGAHIILINSDKKSFFFRFIKFHQYTFVKTTDTLTITVEKKDEEVKNLDENITTVISFKNGARNYNLFSFLYADFLAKDKKLLPDSDKELNQTLIVNTTVFNNDETFKYGIVGAVLVFFLILTFSSRRYNIEHFSGADLVWNVNGVPRMALFTFKIIINTFVPLLVILIPVLIGRLAGKDSLRNITASDGYIYVFFAISVIAFFTALISEIFSKNTFNMIGTYILTFIMMATFIGSLSDKIGAIWLGQILVRFPLIYSYRVFCLFISEDAPLFLSFLIYLNFLDFKKFFEKFGFWEFTWSVFFWEGLITLGALTGLIIFVTTNWYSYLAELFKRRLVTSSEEIENKKKLGPVRGQGENQGELVVELKEVNKFYGLGILGRANQALNNFSLEARKGEHVGVLGANGGGKSTAFKILVKEILPTSGDIRIEGAALSSCKPGYMGYVPQYEALIPDLTPYQTLRFYNILYGRHGAKSHHDIKACLISLKLRNNMHKPVGKLSGGTKRKVILAVAMLLNRNLVILDEPTTGIDITNCQDIWDEIKRKTANRTILLASHSIAETELLTNRIVVLVKGKVVAFGTKEEIQNNLGKYYEIEFEMKNKGSEEQMDQLFKRLQRLIITKFADCKFEERSKTKFVGFVNKNEIELPKLIRMIADNKEEYEIEEFYANESTLDVILSEQLEANKKK